MDEFHFVVKSQSSAKQLVKYAAVGVAINLVGYLVYLMVTNFGATPKITMTILYGMGVAIGFWGNRRLTFGHEGSMLKAGVRYVIAHCFGYLINLGIIILMVDKLGYAHQWVQAVAIFVVAIFLFLVFKYFVFADQNALNVDRL